MISPSIFKLSQGSSKSIFKELLNLIITKKAPVVSMDIGTQWWEVLITIVLVSVLPAIGEEVLFRGGVARQKPLD